MSRKTYTLRRLMPQRAALNRIADGCHDTTDVCPVCGKQIPISRNSNALTCSQRCTIRKRDLARRGKALDTPRRLSRQSKLHMQPPVFK